MSEASPTTPSLDNTHEVASEGASVTPALEGEALKEELQKQLDYVFSKDHLSTDPFLVSKMSADNFVPISVIRELPLIKNLTTDESLIRDALSSIASIVVDEEKQMARPAEKLVQRNTIILRDIPENTQVEEIRALFSGQEKFLAAVDEMKSDIANTFFIKFNNEEVTLEACIHLREQTLNGVPVQARIKSENLIKSYYYGAPSYYNNNNNSQDAGSTVNPYANWNRSYEGAQGYQTTEGGGYRGYNNDGRRGGRGGFNPTRRRKDFRGGKAPFDAAARGGRRPATRGGKKSPSPSKSDARRPNNNNTVLPVAPSHWPPLPSTSNEKKTKTGGYREDFTKYSREEIISVINSVKEELQPHLENQCAAILENGFHSELEVSKPSPPNAKIEWVDAKKGPSRKTSLSKKGRNANKKAGEDKANEAAGSNSTPPNAWPSVNSSNVKQPPTTQQQKNFKQKPKPTNQTPKQNTKSQPNKSQQNKQQPKQQQKPAATSAVAPAPTPASAAATPQSTEAAPSAPAAPQTQETSAVSTGTSNPTPAASTTQPAQPQNESNEATEAKSNNPSYADIARARQQPVPAATQD